MENPSQQVWSGTSISKCNTHFEKIKSDHNFTFPAVMKVYCNKAPLLIEAAGFKQLIFSHDNN